MKDLIHFFNRVKIYLSLYNWDIKFIDNQQEGYCYKERKTIEIGLKNRNPKELILHELCHAYTSRFCNNKHDHAFLKELLLLRQKFLGKNFHSNYDKNFINYPSIYALKYANTKFQIFVKN